MVTLFWFKSFCCWGLGGLLEMDLKENFFVLFFKMLPRRSWRISTLALPTTSVLFVTIVVGAIVAHTCFAFE